jgi:hypothetical protein
MPCHIKCRLVRSMRLLLLLNEGLEVGRACVMGFNSKISAAQR